MAKRKTAHRKTAHRKTAQAEKHSGDQSADCRRVLRSQGVGAARLAMLTDEEREELAAMATPEGLVEGVVEKFRDFHARHLRRLTSGG